jgi:hypothetical protein
MAKISRMKKSQSEITCRKQPTAHFACLFSSNVMKKVLRDFPTSKVKLLRVYSLASESNIAMTSPDIARRRLHLNPLWKIGDNPIGVKFPGEVDLPASVDGVKEHLQSHAVEGGAELRRH